MKKLSVFIILIAAIFTLSACNTGQGAGAQPSPSVSGASQGAESAPAAEDDLSVTIEDTVAAPASVASTEEQPLSSPTPSSSGAYEAIPLPEEMRAMWISFLEWQEIDISTEEALRTNVGQMFDNCASMGLNTVIVAVRPFADALYKSEYYPWSHLITGTQGTDPGFDPLAAMIEEAHARNLRIEAWINPYRVQHPTHGPDTLSENNPATANPSWVRKEGGLWLDPGLPEVRELVVNGVVEIVENYEIDGIHFDDYFYPEGNTAAFDAETYTKYGNGEDLGSWRRGNVNEMVRSVYAAIQAANPSVSFGISPQGNNENNYNMHHCDIKLWMSEPGYVDYIMPQLYWGFDYIRNGNDKAAFANKVDEWSSYRLLTDVKLYAGLGAYRIGEGDQSDSYSGEWQSGHVLADMAQYISEAELFDGFALFNYNSLFPGEDSTYAALAAQEALALTAVLTEAETQ